YESCHFALHDALPIYEGGRQTLYGLANIWTGVFVLLKEALSGGGSTLGQVTGPIGIASLAGQAQSLGFTILLSFAAFISLNLARSEEHTSELQSRENL